MSELEELKKALWDISVKLRETREELSEIKTILKDWMVYQGAYKQKEKTPNRPVKDVS